MNDQAPKTDESIAAANAAKFTLPSPVDSVERYGKGLINATYLVTSGGSYYVLQRINDTVFPEPERIMANLAVLEGHLATHADSEIRIPDLIAAKDGRPFVRDAQGGVWRLMEFIADTRVLAGLDDLEQAKEVGRILGHFHVVVSTLPAAQLQVTLPDYHITPSYLERFTKVSAASTLDRTDEIRQAIGFVTNHQGKVSVLEDARRAGRVPERVTHGDPKLDNILFQRGTSRAVSLIDLDTVQPGLIHYDIGDCLRSCCNRKLAASDTDAKFDLDICRAILCAYAEETRNLLTTAEIELLFDAIRLIPFELGLRYITDHLEGDRYFRVSEPEQNLRKAQSQFALVRDIEGKEQEIRRIIDECFGLGGKNSEGRRP